MVNDTIWLPRSKIYLSTLFCIFNQHLYRCICRQAHALWLGQMTSALMKKSQGENIIFSTKKCKFISSYTVIYNLHYVGPRICKGIRTKLIPCKIASPALLYMHYAERMMSVLQELKGLTNYRLHFNVRT